MFVWVSFARNINVVLSYTFKKLRLIRFAQSNIYVTLCRSIFTLACNCSALAISNECDLLTGRCQCEEGAIGLKCDDCAFGFIGNNV